MFLMIWAFLLTLLAGEAVNLVCLTGVFNASGPKRINWKEFLIGAAICALVIVPGTVIVGRKIALNNNLQYHEFWSGYEVSADQTDTECHRDGSCQFTYNCDPYIVTIHHSATYDSKGNMTSPAYDTEETHYHSCPEATHEWDFSINTTLGNYHIERTFPTDAQLFRGDHGLSGNVRVGVPPFWQDASDHLKAGDPRPVTVKKTYDNYLLASQDSILHQFSDAVDKYKSVLPAPASTKDVYNFYYANKEYSIGTDPGPGWNEALMRFNAAFGSELQGDLHVVIVGDGVTSDPDEFTGALNAYWTGTKFNRDALSKNGLVVVLGAKDGKVAWSRAFTGMPLGNEALITDLRNDLKGLPLTPDAILGTPKGQLQGNKFTGITHTAGAIEKDVWGTHKFARISMSGKHGGGGFGYLSSEIQPSTGQKFWILFTATFFSLIIWGAFVALGVEEEKVPNKKGNSYDGSRDYHRSSDGTLG